MDKVSGNCTEKIEPFPNSESIEIEPPNELIVLVTTSKPTPRPETSETFSAVENPEQKSTDKLAYLLIQLRFSRLKHH